ncbi:hypothetical protein [Nostoc parmelioides]|uniref:Transposase n=1 Tax=Nostoc parmelioides FACHB-3921 TaxID=2692909 RepID=A0ABR8BJM9_9NOSO|nr:hypothetical protein [Nostoc parmelioides]MBD2254308.1 hypothetical protein [Nostoc parmelioides FACHB-3921]
MKAVKRREFLGYHNLISQLLVVRDAINRVCTVISKPSTVNRRLLNLKIIT